MTASGCAIFLIVMIALSLKAPFWVSNWASKLIRYFFLLLSWKRWVWLELRSIFNPYFELKTSGHLSTTDDSGFIQTEWWDTNILLVFSIPAIRLKEDWIIILALGWATLQHILLLLIDLFQL